MSFITQLSQKAISSFQRFPIVLLWVVMGSLYLIGIYGTDNFELIQQNEGLTLVFILGVSWLIGSQFLSEALNHNTLNRYVFKLFIVLSLGLFSYYIGTEVSNTDYGRWGLLLLAGHVFVVFAPFVKVWHKHKFWNYLKSILLALVRSSLYALVLYIGLALAISALELLFDIDFNSYIYLQTFIFCLGIVNTFVYLSDFPELNKIDSQVNFNKASEVLILYILMPLSLLYILIVYCYAFKILIDWELPRGWVTYLISALSLLAFVIHIAIEPVRKTHKAKLIQKFFPYYFYSILPLIPLLFIALYKRITDYNFTELRYLGLVLAIWIVGMLGYMLISHKKALTIYAKSMFLLILLSTFGPLSAFKISINAQFSELKELMQGVEEKPDHTFTTNEFERFKSIIRYIANRDALDRTETYFGFNPELVFSETGSYRMPRKIVDSLQIKVINDKSAAAIEKAYTLKSYRINPYETNFTEEITDYTNFTLLEFEETKDDQKALQLHYSNDNIVSLRYYGESLFETDLTSHLKAKADKYDYLNQAKPDEFTFRLKNDRGDFLVIFQEFKYSYVKRTVEIKSGKAMLFYRTYEGLELP